MEHLSIKQISSALRQRKFSSVELTQYYLKQIDINQQLNAFIHVDEKLAITAAKQADQKLQKKEGSMLTGIPMAVKDLFCTKEMPTTCASKMLAQFQPPYSATVVSRLQDQGAVLVGKTNMDEFAMGSSNEHSYFGAVLNPWDAQRVPGGSSGGSAAAIAGGLIPYALGSDTGGSIRQPAAFCGISGIKPTYGMASRHGMIAYASSMDQAGPMAYSAEDLAIILQAMVGHDRYDSTSVKQPPVDYLSFLDKPNAPLRIGIPTFYKDHALDAPIQRCIDNALSIFRNFGAEVVFVDLHLQPLWVPCYYVIACAEASSNLSRYDGIRFGHRSQRSESLAELIKHSRSEGFGMEVKRRILTGTHLLSSACFSAYYLQAQKIRRLIQQELLRTLEQVDVLIGPTTPQVAFHLGVKKENPVQNYLSDVFTVAANLAGLPALSIPAGFAHGLPVGMQLMGRHFSEASLLKWAHEYQKRTEWHQARPILRDKK